MPEVPVTAPCPKCRIFYDAFPDSDLPPGCELCWDGRTTFDLAANFLARVRPGARFSDDDVRVLTRELLQRFGSPYGAR